MKLAPIDDKTLVRFFFPVFRLELAACISIQCFYVLYCSGILLNESNDIIDLLKSGEYVSFELFFVAFVVVGLISPMIFAIQRKQMPALLQTVSLSVTMIYLCSLCFCESVVILDSEAPHTVVALYVMFLVLQGLLLGACAFFVFTNPSVVHVVRDRFSPELLQIGLYITGVGMALHALFHFFSLASVGMIHFDCLFFLGNYWEARERRELLKPADPPEHNAT